MVAPLVFVFCIEEGFTLFIIFVQYLLTDFIFLPLFSFMSFLRDWDQKSRQYSRWGPIKIHSLLGSFWLDLQYLKLKSFYDYVDHFAYPLGQDSLMDLGLREEKCRLAVWRSSVLSQIIFSKVYFLVHLIFKAHLYLSFPSFCILTLYDLSITYLL